MSDTHTDYEIVQAALKSAHLSTTLSVRLLIRDMVRDLTGWNLWDGGECPVSSDTQVEIMMRTGHQDIHTARRFRWKYEDLDGDIIAYRITEPDISELRGWVHVTDDRGDVSVLWASDLGIGTYKSRYTRTWTVIKNSGWTVRKLTPEDISESNDSMHPKSNKIVVDRDEMMEQFRAVIGWVSSGVKLYGHVDVDRALSFLTFLNKGEENESSSDS